MTTSWGLVVTLFLLVVLWSIVLIGLRPSQPKPAGAPLSDFSAERAQALLQELMVDGIPHPLGSPANAQIRARILRHLEQLGLHPETQSGFMICNKRGDCGIPVNIVARIEGNDSASAVLLCAHYDSVPAGPGMSDDGTGVATLLELARLLRERPRPRHSIVLLIDDGEEAGLLGAEAFVRHHRWAGSVKAAVNLDARGTSGPSFMFQTGSANNWLMRLFGAAVERPVASSVYYAAYKKTPNDTDFTVFKAAGYQGFDFAFIDNVGRYHTPLDAWSSVDTRSIQQQGDEALAALWALANVDVVGQRAAEANYFDLFGRVLVRFPSEILLPVTGLGLLAFVWLTVRLVNKRCFTPATVLWGSLWALLTLLVSTATALALLFLMRVAGTVPPAGSSAFVAFPWALLAAFSALAFLVIGVLGSFLRDRAGFWGLYWGGTALNLVLAMILSVWLPGAGYLTLLPGVAALLGLSALLGRGRDTLIQREVTAGAICGVSFLLLLPVLVPLYSALGTDCLPMLTVVLAVGGSSLSALLAEASSAVRRGCLGVSALVMFVCCGVAFWLPKYSPSSPQRVNISYQIDVSTQGARWLVDADSKRLPARISGVAVFNAVPEQSIAWSVRRFFTSSAPRMSLQPPELEHLTQIWDNAQVSYRAHVVSKRSAPKLLLAFSPSGGAVKVRVENAEEFTPVPTRTGWSVIRLAGLPAQGVDITFSTAAQPFDITLVDESYGLPEFGRTLQLARSDEAAASQDGDLTIVRQTVHLAPNGK